MTAKMKTLPKSDAFEAIHSAAMGLHKVGVIDQSTMRKFDEACLVPVPKYASKDVKRIRMNVHVSQAVLAAHMNVSVSTVQKWEAGAKAVSGAAAKLLNLVERKGSIDAIA
jgi:putative transcriptional regulator